MGARPRSPPGALVALLALSACALALCEQRLAKAQQPGRGAGRPDVLIHIANTYWMEDHFFRNQYNFIARRGRSSQNLSCVFTKAADTAATADAVW